MPSFNFEHERDRIAELKKIGMDHTAIVQTVQTNVRTNLLERTGALSSFNLEIAGKKVSQVGYEHRGDGDLDASYKLSEEAATESYIEKRYRLENEGYAEAKKRFFDVPLGSTILLMSPPPDQPIPGYPGHSMAYFYHILPHESGNPDKRTVKALGWVNYFANEEQAALLNNQGTKNHVMPTEESILRNPTFAAGEGVDTRSFRTLWEKIGEQYRKQERSSAFRYVPAEIAEQFLLDGEEMWEKYHGDLAIMTTNIAERLARGESASDIGKDWDIMLNLADRELMHVDVTAQISSEREILPGQVVFDAYRDLSYAPRVAATLCGESSGVAEYGVGGMFTTATYTVDRLGMVPMTASAGEKTLNCKCPFCKVQVDAVIKDGKITCPRDGCGKSASYQC